MQQSAHAVHWNRGQVKSCMLYLVICNFSSSSSLNCRCPSKQGFCFSSVFFLHAEIFTDIKFTRYVILKCLKTFQCLLWLLSVKVVNFVIALVDSSRFLIIWNFGWFLVHRETLIGLKPWKVKVSISKSYWPAHIY